MDKHQALDYLVNRSSVKIFPESFYPHVHDLNFFVREAERLGINIMVLNRNVEDAWISFINANATGIFNGSVKNDSVALLVNEKEHKKFVGERKEYDNNVNEFLKDMGVRHDIFDYDEIKDVNRIVARENECYIQNCNFVS